MDRGSDRTGRENLDEFPRDWDFTDLLRGDLVKCTLGKVYRVCVLASRTSVGNSGNHSFSIVQVGDLDLASTVTGLFVQVTVHVGLQCGNFRVVRVVVSAGTGGAILVEESGYSASEDLSST